MLYRPKRRSEVSVELSPLIDVVFLLLIFFMVSTTFKDAHGMDLNLPSAESESKAGQEALTLVVRSDGSLEFQGETVTEDALGERLAASLTGREDKMLVLKVDESVEHGRVVTLMDAAKNAGASGLTFAAKPKRGDAGQ
ncbi:MAG: biopolymer transporter ExbD [Acidobacteria bacterium]|nr:biopolymer transporter ExbD [Acidobacteriota bacterium]